MVGAIALNGPSATAQNVIGGATSRADYCHKKSRKIAAKRNSQCAYGRAEDWNKTIKPCS
jgi:hypothetical protein